jgi:uncharacterized Tic20 family protein
MDTAAENPDFSDRPWMDPESPPLGEAEPRRPDSGFWSEPAAWRAACHAIPLLAWLLPMASLGIAAPLLIWQAKAKGEGDLLLTKEAVEALNFQLNVAVLSALLSITVIGLVLVPFVWLGASVLAIIASVQAWQGGGYRYPWILRPITAD